MAELKIDSNPEALGQFSLTESFKCLEEFPGIYWEEVGSLSVPVEMKRAISLEISDQLRRLTAFFETRPDVAIIRDSTRLSEDEAELLAMDILHKDPPSPSLIRVFPSCLKAVLAEKAGVNQQSPSISLIGGLGHEVFHIFQRKNAREQFEKDLILTGEGSLRERLATWGTSLTEKKALEFESHWIEHWREYPKTAK
jgi:hypothetical protein